MSWKSTCPYTSYLLCVTPITPTTGILLIGHCKLAYCLEVDRTHMSLTVSELFKTFKLHQTCAIDARRRTPNYGNYLGSYLQVVPIPQRCT
jgi:hypothetical protein